MKINSKCYLNLNIMGPKKNSKKQCVEESSDNDSESVSHSEVEVEVEVEKTKKTKAKSKTVSKKTKSTSQPESELAEQPEEPSETKEIKMTENKEWVTEQLDKESCDLRESESESNDDRHNNGQFTMPKNSRPERFSKPKQNKHDNSAINFNYGQYRTMCEDKSTQDLIKILVSRAHDGGQRQLCETMKQTLRAMNFECNFPEVTHSHPPKENDPNQGSRGQYRTGKPYQKNNYNNYNNDNNNDNNYDNNYRSHATGFSYKGKDDSSRHPKPHFGNRQ